MPKLTVIIPAYNAEPYIEASLSTLLRQSYRDFRVIVVNDGSTDATGEILRRLAEEDGRLETVTVPNGGPAMARNRALERLDGDTEYVMFMDADDELEPDTLEYALNGAKGADMVIFGFLIRNPDGSIRRYFEPELLIPAEKMGASLAGLYKANLLNQVWGKLYRRSLIEDNRIRFPDYRWGEDRIFIYDCMEHIRSVSVLPACKYHYIMHPGESLITRYYDKKPDICLEVDARMEKLAERFGADDGEVFRYMFAKGIFSCITMLYMPSCPLSFAEKRTYVRRVVENERVRRRCRDCFGGAAVNLLCAVLRTGSVGLNMLVFRFVAAAGQLAPALFTRLKHRK